MGLPAYCNAGHVRGAADIPVGPQADADIARAIDDGARHIEALCHHRHFYPLSGTFTMDWPDRAGVNSDSRKLWLDDNEVISVSSLVVADAAVTSFRLTDANAEGQAHRAIEMLWSGSDTWSTGDDDYQDPISITGVRGFTDDTTPYGTLGTAIGDTSSTSIQIANASGIDIGDAILIESESMIVTATSNVDTTENLLAALTVDSADQSIAVADGALYAPGEILIVGSERMRVDDIAGNTLTVRRAVHGTTLAAHALGADIYARRGLTVERGALGTTAAVHSTTTVPVYRHKPPGAVEALNVGLALVQLAQENAGYARTIGQGEGEREERGAGIERKTSEVRRRYAIKGMVFATGGGVQ